MFFTLVLVFLCVESEPIQVCNLRFGLLNNSNKSALAFCISWAAKRSVSMVGEITERMLHYYQACGESISKAFLLPVL
jgi:hypothetical protein